MLRTANNSAFSRIYSEIAASALATFQARDPPDAEGYARSLAARLCGNSGIPPEHVLNGADVCFTFDPVAVAKVVSSLTPETARVELITQYAEVAQGWPDTDKADEDDDAFLAAARNHRNNNNNNNGDNGDDGRVVKTSKRRDVGADAVPPELVKPLRKKAFDAVTQHASAQFHRERLHGTVFCAAFTLSLIHI